MIKFIHRNKQSIGIVFLFIAFCFAVSGVGLDILHSGPNPNRDAATINGQKISSVDIARSEKNIESRYRQMFGDQYAQFASQLNLNIRQQAIDSLVDRTILDQEARKQGYAASDDAVREYLLTTIFKEQPFSPPAYRNLLQNVGMTAPQFESEIKDDIVRSTLVNLLRDAAVVSAKDAEALLKKQKTKYSVLAATISIADVLPKVSPPQEADLKKFYENHATEYELPAQVSYSYLTFTPKDFEKDVQVSQSDVEFYYAENSANFTIPEQAHIRSIKLLYPKESDPAKMAAVREKANKAREEALSGQKFKDLVAKYSDDLPTKPTGGDLGWVKKGEKSDAIDSAIAKTTVGAISELIETDYGFEILKVEEKQPARPQPLEEVRASIEQAIRAQESPAYASNRARELLTQAKKENKSLAEILPPGISLKETKGSLAQNSDPEPSLRGLTQNALMLPAGERLQPTLIELGDSTVLLQIKEYKEPSTPAFEEVKDRVTSAVVAEEARKLAETKADELLKASQANPATFTTEAAARSAKVVGPFELSREQPSSDKFPALTAQMRTAIMNSDKANEVVGRVFPSAKDFTLFKVEEIKAPDLTTPAIVEELGKYRSRANQELSQNMIASTLDLLKSRSTIDIDPSIYGNQTD